MSLSTIACAQQINSTLPLEKAQDNLSVGKSLYQSTDWVDDDTFTQGVEGPAVSPDGILYAVNFAENGTIGKVVGENKGSVLVNLPNGSIGNGIRFDAKGNMYIADYINHNILTISANKLKSDSVNSADVKVYAHSELMSQPNDIAIGSDGKLFASDPNWSESNGQLWRIDTDGQVVLLEKDMGTTNGIEVSPDNKTLYVNESVQRKVWQYQLSADGEITDKKLLIQFEDYGLDGMRVDVEGNLYIARYGKGVIAIVSPQGLLLREVQLKGKFPTNVSFGGEEGKKVFVTLQKRGAIETFYSEFTGRSFSHF